MVDSNAGCFDENDVNRTPSIESINQKPPQIISQQEEQICNSCVCVCVCTYYTSTRVNNNATISE